MHKRLISMAAGLSDAELLRRVALLAGRERDATVELVGHLAELDARKLHIAEGYGSLFAYCTGALRLGEHAAYNRIEAARLSRRVPAVLDLLGDGSLNLSTARLLSPHLRPDNFETLVAQARGRSKREVEALVARLAPRPDVAASVRQLPLLLRDAARKKLAAVGKPCPRQGTRRSRHIPAPVKRAVWLRDGSRCAFVAASGRRCTERVFLEFHHREPYAIGGEATVANVSLRCRAHNVYEAELAFGPGVPRRRCRLWRCLSSAKRPCRMGAGSAARSNRPRGDTRPGRVALTRPA